MKLKSFSWLIIGGGILFSLYLQGQVTNGVYFSGDGGLKALLAKQLASGELRFDLAIPEASWIQNLWNSGLYPYEEPYVYQVADKYYITFPYTFPLVTAPFYALFGYRGLYIIPLVSCWVTWIIFYGDCLKLKLNNFVTALGLICLIFSSYLTIYSAMYWEHSLAVALAFSGLSLWFSNNDRPSIIKTIFSGFLIGLAVWFRPEFVCVVIIMLGLAVFTAIYSKIPHTFFCDRQQLKPILFPLKKQLILAISMVLTVGCFFVTNKIIYGYAVGIHGIQAVESVGLGDRLIGSWQNFTAMILSLAQYLPIVFIPILYLIFYLIQKILLSRLFGIKFSSLYIIIYGAIIAFIIGVSLLVPVGTAGLIPGGKQWGVRFLLMLVPVITLLATVQFQQLWNQKNLKYIAVFITILLVAVGINKNVVQATETLVINNRITAPAVEFLQTDTNKYIAISHEFVGQAIEAATVDEEVFFTVDTVPELIQFSQALIERQQDRFTYICYPHRACDLPKASAAELEFKQGESQYQIRLTEARKFGKYPIHRGKIEVIEN